MGMTRPSIRPQGPPLPIKGDLRLPTALSLLVVGVMAVASLAGWFFSSALYPTEEALQSFAANDIVNIFIGVPILLGSMALARRGKLIGLLFWPGGLLYPLYNYLAYLVGVPIGWASLAYLALILASLIALILLLGGMDAGAIQARLQGAVHERLGGGALAVFGVFVVLRDLGVLVSAQTDPSVNLALELPVLVADLVLSVVWIGVGVQLWRRRALGYTLGAGLLFQASMLFVGLIAFLLLQPVLTDVPLAMVDVVVVALMGLICFVPLALFTRGVIHRERRL